MTSPGEKGNIPCVEQPALEAYDKDGDGMLSIDELRLALPNDIQVQGIITALEETGVMGIRYGGCGEPEPDGAKVASNGAGEDLARAIAQLAVAGLYDGEAN